MYALRPHRIVMTDKFEEPLTALSYDMTLTFTHLLRTISIGTPGFTIAIFIHSLPRSTDMTATDTANTKTCYIKLVRHKANTKDPEVQ